MEGIQVAAETEGLTVAYDEKPVLWDVDCKIPKGQLVAVIGPNGAGKTTLIKAMLGLIRPVSGTVRFFGEERRRGQVRDTRIGYVPQSESVDWDFPATVLDIVLMGCYGSLGWFRRPQKKDAAMAKQMLGKVGMTGFEHRQISQLSGGQQQRVAIARSLIYRPALLLADEPTGNLDQKNSKEIIDMLKLSNRSLEQTILLITHDEKVALEAERIITVEDGRIIRDERRR